MKATGFKIEGTNVEVPTHVDLVEGISEYVDGKISNNNRDIDSKINSLTNVYLGKNAKAVSAGAADSATIARGDSDGNRFQDTYMKKGEQAASAVKAIQDGNGLQISSTYAKITGSVANAGYATTAGSATKATKDEADNNIRSTYIKKIEAVSNSNRVVYTRGDNTTGEFATNDTTYGNATTTNAGLMSAEDKVKLNGIAAGAQVNPTNVATANKLSTARTIAITGAGSGSQSFDGSANISISLANLNASSITTGTLAVGRGGTGQTSLANVTGVGSANKLTTARTIDLAGAAKGQVAFDGSANVTLTVSGINPSMSTLNGGILPVANGGTGNKNGTVGQLTTARAINGVDFNGTAPIVFSGVCTTAAATQTKVVSISGFNLVEGATVSVLFTKKNTHASPRLNVNGKGDKPIYRGGAQADANFMSAENQTLTFRYSTTVVSAGAWHMVDPVVSLAKEATHAANATTADSLKAAATINGYVMASGGQRARFFGGCATEADDPVKVITGLNGFKPTTGDFFGAIFAHVNCAEGYPSLDVNGDVRSLKVNYKKRRTAIVQDDNTPALFYVGSGSYHQLAAGWFEATTLSKYGDLDDYTTGGVYYILDIMSCNHCPNFGSSTAKSMSAILVVYETMTQWVQVAYFPWINAVLYRMYSSSRSSWGDWRQFTTEVVGTRVNA